jgi:Lrp/AsnC family leucine-responsive transcriptional regulator
MLPNILKYESIQKFIQGIKDEVLEYVDKDKLCVIGLGENGVFYGEGMYHWLKNRGLDVNFTTINDEGEGLEENKIKNRKILMVDSHIITGTCYQRALRIVRSKQKKLKVKDIKCAVMHDLRGFADFVAERYLSPIVKLDKIDLEIIKILSEEGRKSFTEIAKKIGLTPVGTKNRIDRLFREGILSLKGLINLEKFYSVSANIGISADNLTCERLMEKLKQNPLVYNLMKVSGNKSLIIDIVAPNLQIIEEFLDQEIRSEPRINFIEVNTGGLPILPKEVTMKQFKPLASEVNLKKKNAKRD